MSGRLFEPFRAWLVRPEWAGSVIAGAYDAKTPGQRRAIVEENPFSYFGVTRSREDLIDGADLTDDDLLELGAQTLTRILEADAFSPAPHPALFAYRLDYDAHSQTGVVGALDIDGLSDGRVLTHENVRPERASLLARHLGVVGATSSPISLTHEPDPELRSILASATQADPYIDHTIEGVRHRIWTLSEADSAAVAAVLADTTVYVTDGHHRSAAALAARGAHPDDPAFERMLAVLFPADELRVEAFHRRAPDYDQRGLEELCAALSTVGSIEPVADMDAGRTPGVAVRSGSTRRVAGSGWSSTRWSAPPPSRRSTSSASDAMSSAMCSGSTSWPTTVMSTTSPAPPESMSSSAAATSTARSASSCSPPTSTT